MTDNTAIAFTGGSCLNNPRPCGAGAILFVEEETTELKQPVCKRGSILLGELIAQYSGDDLLACKPWN
jgi:ribonuclease HI